MPFTDIIVILIGCMLLDPPLLFGLQHHYTSERFVHLNCFRLSATQRSFRHTDAKLWNDLSDNLAMFSSDINFMITFWTVIDLYSYFNNSMSTRLLTRSHWSEAVPIECSTWNYCLRVKHSPCNYLIEDLVTIITQSNYTLFAAFHYYQVWRVRLYAGVFYHLTCK